MTRTRTEATALSGKPASPRRWRLHRSLGWTSVVLAPALIVSGALVVRVMLGQEIGFSVIPHLR